MICMKLLIHLDEEKNGQRIRRGQLLNFDLSS